MKELVVPDIDLSVDKPRQAKLYCPWCGARHIDKDEWAERPHHKHLCQNPVCGKLFRVEPYSYGAADPPVEKVNHPKHYNLHPSGVEAIDLCELLSFNVGNAVKYLFRADHKDAPIEDLKKAAWYLQRALDRHEHALVVHADKDATVLLMKRVFDAAPTSVLGNVLWELFDSRRPVLERYVRAIEIVQVVVQERQGGNPFGEGAV